MKKIEIIKRVSAVLAGSGVIAFWILGFKGLTAAAAWAIAASGCFCWIALGAILISHVRSRNLC